VECGLHNVDLKSAYDSVDKLKSLCLLLHRLGIPDKMGELWKELYTETCCCVLADRVRSEWFAVLSGVRQGCAVAPDLFLILPYVTELQVSLT